MNKSRCCGRCDGVNDLCVSDMECEKHTVLGCEDCYGKRQPKIEIMEDDQSTVAGIMLIEANPEGSLPLPWEFTWESSRPPIIVDAHKNPVMVLSTGTMLGGAYDTEQIFATAKRILTLNNSLSAEQLVQFNKMRAALSTIKTEYMTPEEIREDTDKEDNPLDYEELLEMSYENIQGVAENAVRGVLLAQDVDKLREKVAGTKLPGES